SPYTPTRMLDGSRYLVLRRLGRLVVLRRRTSISGVSPVFLHPLTLSAFRDAVGTPVGTDLLLCGRLPRRVSAGAAVLLFRAPQGSPLALAARASGSVFLFSLVRGRLRLLLRLFEQASTLSHARHARSGGVCVSRRGSARLSQ